LLTAFRIGTLFELYLSNLFWGDSKVIWEYTHWTWSG